ncbi:MAG TPA: ribosomal protein S18-alanine N-acetyltransferase [Woeseiaceae bacterium]|nr:ribosomal protein S18-alanine N-acetyltransferase [Woeseiaceae bacterium]
MIRPVAHIPVRTRTMVHDDLTIVSDIERRSYEFPWSHGVFRDCLLAGYTCIVLERESRVAGYAILSVAAGEAHILNLCVDPDYRNLGYGDSLLEEVLQRARHASVKEVFLEVRPSNVNALALYRKKGFRQIASRRAYYQAKRGREDAAVLSLVLKSR